ncbi:hypothetical protein [Halalkalibacterium ligniniphilum]|uniref:hypothetical protein n=1 Tax=Halalkalibacterium ligniniphilum TaxID=1134413 RepID=UPI00047541B6|nr:hypothetical protein [Halalkalibacterium ligniniphilum]
MNNQVVRCDDCGRSTKMALQVRKYGQGMQETYFECEHCTKKYTCYVTDERARKLQKKLRNEKNPVIKFQLQAKLQERMIKLKRELMDSV